MALCASLLQPALIFAAERQKGDDSNGSKSPDEDQQQQPAVADLATSRVIKIFARPQTARKSVPALVVKLRQVSSFNFSLSSQTGCSKYETGSFHTDFSWLHALK